VDHDDVLDRLTRWAGGDPNVRALVLTGSAAAGAPHPLSDRDLEVYVDDPTPLLDDDSWWSELGEVLVVERLHAPAGTRHGSSTTSAASWTSRSCPWGS
jgi:aminoglycoside 6-adenylyltransferase